MERQYDDGTANDVVFFTGVEIEHTPAYNMNTLFVVGIQSVDEIVAKATEENIQHIYLGANQSYYESEAWDDIIRPLLDKEFLVTLDFPLTSWEFVLESGYDEWTNFIPQVSVKIPYVTVASYNTVIKIDDIGFEKTNPGVWCHQLHDLMDRKKFTMWHKYKNDKIIKQDANDS